MNSFKVLRFLILFQLGFSAGSNTKSSLASYAINSILTEHFSKKSHTVDIVQFGFKNTKESILKSVCFENKKISFKVVNSEENNIWRRKLDTSSVVSFDSVQTFKSIVKNMTWWVNRYDLFPKNLVFIRNSTASEINEIIEGQNHIHNVNFLTNESEQAIDLVSPQMFRSKSCRAVKLVRINRFRKNTMRWDNSSFFPQKYRNLQGCTLNVKDSVHWIGKLAFKTIKALASSLNYNTQYMNESLSTEFDLYNDMTSTGKLSERTSTSMITVSNTFFVPPGELYTPLEKMFMTFEIEVWIAIIVTLLIAFAAIQVINLGSSKIQDFVFGRNIRTPTLNIYSGYFSHWRAV